MARTTKLRTPLDDLRELDRKRALWQERRKEQLRLAKSGGIEPCHICGKPAPFGYNDFFRPPFVGLVARFACRDHRGEVDAIAQAERKALERSA